MLRKHNFQFHLSVASVIKTVLKLKGHDNHAKWMEVFIMLKLKDPTERVSQNKPALKILHCSEMCSFSLKYEPLSWKAYWDDLVTVTTIQTFKQKQKKRKKMKLALFPFRIPPWPWHKIKVTKPGINRWCSIVVIITHT